ncbi:YafY family transcriptional regulator [Staphylococcus sp. SS21]|nr:YafY family transcriptional regulator [Staphylococcus singaporensis]
MKISRLISIILLLNERKRVSANELSELMEVSKRTIYRDVEAINIAGIPVYSIPGVGGGFEIMENFKIDKNTFTENELASLLISNYNFPDKLKNMDFYNTNLKIKSLIPKEKINIIDTQVAQFYMDSNHWSEFRNIDDQVIKFKKAIQNNQVLKVKYINHLGNITEREVEPYQLILKAGEWYGYVYCNLRDDFRLLKLTRVMNIQDSDRKFIEKVYKDPLLSTDRIFEKLKMTIKLRVHESIVERLLDFCNYECFMQENNRHYVVDFPFIDNSYYYGLILSFGDKCEIIEPTEIRNKMKQIIKKMANNYK